ncbi:MAG: hypothetical protein ABSF26_23725 [Thermoguttaceae bacterium]|jgi:hypothetical protein
MKPVELFGVIVRTIGLLVTMCAVFLIFVATVHLVLRGPGFIEGYLLGVPGLFIGIYFLSGAELLVNSVYPKEP